MAGKRGEGRDEGAQPQGESSHKVAWITSVVGALGVIIAALIGLLAQQDGGGSAADSRPPASTPPATPSAAGASASATPAAAGSSSASGDTGAAVEPQGGAVQWQGVLLLDNSPAGSKDLDPQRPVSTGDKLDDKVDFYGYFGEIRAGNNARASLWTGGGLPEYADCAGTVDAAGAEAQPVKAGTVLCVRTSEGRVGRLKVTAADDETTSIQFDGVVWGLAGQ